MSLHAPLYAPKPPPRVYELSEISAEIISAFPDDHENALSPLLLYTTTAPLYDGLSVTSTTSPVSAYIA